MVTFDGVGHNETELFFIIVTVSGGVEAYDARLQP